MACAACFQQNPKRIHVDFRSAIDGPQVDPSNPRSRHIDWVVICEKCLRDAVGLLPEEQAIKAHLEQQVADLREELTQTQAFADKMEDALSSRPTAPAPRQKPKAAQRRNRYEPVEVEA